MSKEQMLNGLRLGGTLYMGNQRPRYGSPPSPISYRAYWKATDGQKDNLPIPLPPELHRGRFEVTLQNTGLPISTWEEWVAFDVLSLAKHFAQQIPGERSIPGIRGLVRPGRAGKWDMQKRVTFVGCMGIPLRSTSVIQMRS